MDHRASSQGAERGGERERERMRMNHKVNIGFFWNIKFSELFT